MRNDERYRPKPQSNQLEIFGLGMAGEQDVAEAKKWVEANPDAWRFMLSNARRLKEKGYVSINYLVNMVRNELHVGCKNGIAPRPCPNHGGAIPGAARSLQQAPQPERWVFRMSWQRTLAATAHITMHPAQLVGKQRPMTDYRNHRTYTPTKTLKAEKAIKDAFRAAYGETFADHDGPVVMRISTTRPLAKSNPKYWEGRADLGKPDWDNLGKLACDALNGIAFKDDSQVDTGAVTKRPRSPYGTQPRIDIYIEYFVEEYVKEKK